MAEQMTFTAIIRQDDRSYVAKCPEVGTESHGATVEEALENLRQATEIYLSVFPYKPLGEPIFKTFTVTAGKPQR